MRREGNEMGISVFAIIVFLLSVALLLVTFPLSAELRYQECQGRHMTNDHAWAMLLGKQWQELEYS